MKINQALRKGYITIGVILIIAAILTISGCSGRSEENKTSDGNRYMGRGNIDSDQTTFQNDENENGEQDCDEEKAGEPGISSEETRQRGKGRWAQESEDPLNTNTERGSGNGKGNGKKVRIA